LVVFDQESIKAEKLLSDYTIAHWVETLGVRACLAQRYLREAHWEKRKRKEFINPIKNS